MRRLFVLLLLSFVLSGFSQVSDSFSDNDFTQNPVWVGTDNYFVVVAQTLRSNGPNTNGDTQPDTLWLTTHNFLIDSTEWSFLVDLKFNPIADNFLRIYLVSDNQNLTQSLNGYYIQLGQSGNDSINFYKQTGNNRQLLFTGKTSFLSSSNLKARIKVKRDNHGVWQIYSDKTGGVNYISEGNSFTDNSINATQWFGFYCQYKTDSRYNMYYLDDVSVAPVFVDTVKPSVNSVSFLSLNSVEICFSEAIDSGSAVNAQNYLIDQSLGQVMDIQFSTASPEKVILTFQNSASKGFPYDFQLVNVKDLAGNSCIPFQTTIYLPKPFDIVFNEVMTDESPRPAGLPASDYVEIYNRTQYPVSLKGWSLKIKDDGSPIVLSAVTLLPDSFACFVNNAYLDSFQLSTGILPTGLTSLIINNESALNLYDNFSTLIHRIDFTAGWYRDDLKKEGGWSLEQIDVQNPCGDALNWKASVSPAGGTPGRRNSVSGLNPDTKAPYIEKTCLIGNQLLNILFNEGVYINGVINLNQIKIEPSLGVSAFLWNDATQRSANLILSDTVHPDTVYTLQINLPFSDCVGNQFDTFSVVKFAFPHQAVVGELIINEVLFNPKGNGVDYVEVFNRSHHNIDLKTVRLSSYKTETQKLYQMNTVSSGCALLFPDEYLLLTTDTLMIQNQYQPIEKGRWIQMSDFPAFSNEDGVVITCLQDSTVLDRLDYDERMQFALLTSVEGVSLERINPDAKTNQRDNWHSASKYTHWGTPGYKNSQFTEFLYNEDPFTLSPDIFSPDGDGFNDFLTITYFFSQSGTMATVTIYDEKGNLVKKLVNNDLLGVKGSLTWDGTNDQLRKCKIGIYILLFEVYNLNGDRKTYKKTTVLGGKL